MMNNWKKKRKKPISITLDEDIIKWLHKEIGKGNISVFINFLINHYKEDKQ